MSSKLGDIYLDLRMDIKSLKTDIAKSTKELDKVGKSVNKQSKSMGNFRNETIRTMRQIGTLVVAYKALGTAYTTIIGKGIEVNKMYEDQAIGIAALISAKTTMTDGNGKELEGYDKFLASQALTANVMDDIKKAALETPASMGEMLGFYQQTIGHALTANGTFGKSMGDVNKNVILFTQRMSTLGAAVGMEMPKLNEEIRSMMSGNASQDSLLSQMLFGSAAAANKAVKEAKTRAGGLSELLLGKLEPFKHVEGIQTYTKALAQMNAQLEDLQKGGTASLFQDIKTLATDFKTYLENNMADLQATMNGIYDNFRAFWLMMNDQVLSIGNSLRDITFIVSDVGDGVEDAGDNFSFWMNALFAIRGLVNTIHLAILGISSAILAVKMKANSVSNIYNDIFGKQSPDQKRLKMLKSTLAFVDEGTEAYTKQWEEIQHLTDIVDISSKSSLANNKIMEDKLKIDAKIFKLAKDTLTVEGMQEYGAKYYSYKKEQGLILEINKAKTEELVIEKSLEAIRNAGSNERMLKNIAEDTNIKLMQLEALKRATERGGNVTGKGGTEATTAKAGGGGKKATAEAIVNLSRIQAEINKQNLELKDAELSKVITIAEANKRNLDLARAKYAEDFKAFKKTERLERGNGAKGKRKIMVAELKMLKTKTKMTREMNKEALRTAKAVKAIGANLFDDLASGNFKDALSSMADSIQTLLLDKVRDSFATLFSNNFGEAISGASDMIMDAFSSITKAAVVEGDVIGQSNIKNSISTSGAMGGLPMAIAMAALLAGLGLSSASASTGGSSAGRMPSFSQVSGRTGEDRAQNMNGVTLSLQEYNDIVTIAKENGMSFNKSLEAYNDLMAHATVIWQEASTSLRKWGVELGDYQQAVDAMHASGGFDELNEFFSNAATDGENIKYLTGNLQVLSNIAGFDLPVSIDQAKAKIYELMDSFYDAANAADRAKIMTEATNVAKAGNAAVKVAKAQKSAARAAKAAAEEAKRAAEAWARTLVDIAALRADWIGGVAGAKINMAAAEKHTGMSGLTMENFLEKFTAASANGLEQEAFDKWAEMSNAVRALNDAIKQEQAEAIAKLTEKLDHLGDVLGRITDAWTGSLSYLTSMEKIGYLNGIAQEQSGTNQLDTLATQLGYEKSVSRTKEEYMPLFQSYIEKLSVSEPEKTTDDVVDGLDIIAGKIEDMKDAIEQASYQP